MRNFLLISMLSLFLVQGISAKTSQEELAKTRFESLSKLTQVIGTVEKYYVDDIKLEEIVSKALKGLMQELDAHSTYMDKKYFKEMKIQTAGEFGGLGITVGLRDGALTVISPIDDTPAYKAGVKAGDIILKINEISTLNMSLDEAVGHMRGKPKTSIFLTLVRKGEGKPLKIEIIRDIIKIQSVKYEIIHDVGYLRITSFTEQTESGLIKSIKAIQEELDNKQLGFILDAIATIIPLSTPPESRAPTGTSLRSCNAIADCRHASISFLVLFVSSMSAKRETDQ